MTTVINQIEKTINQYFEGTFYPDKIDLLNKAFHPDAHITGNINGNYIDLSLGDFITRVVSLHNDGVNTKYDKQIIGINIVGNIAMVTAKVLVGSDYYIDLISLININGHWVIRNKSFTNNVY